MKKRKSLNRSSNYGFIIMFVICLSVYFLSVGYSAFSATATIENAMATVEPKADARITGVLLSNTTDGATSASENYNMYKIFGNISLPNATSTVTYKVNATVFNAAEMKISAISGLPSNLEYTLTSYNIGDTLCNTNHECNYGATDEFYITIGYAANGYNSSNTSYAFNMDFTFERVEHIARVGNALYGTLNEAVAAVPTNNTQTTVTLLKNTSERVTVVSGQNIVFNFGNFTVSNDGYAPVIENDGTVRISNGTITSNTGQGAINNTGTMYISGGTISATGTRQALYNNGGTLEVSGNPTFTSTTNQRGTLQNLNNGTVTILGGTFRSSAFSAIVNESGTMTIGSKDGTVNSNAPVIQGSVYGITTTPTINFYDGIVKGGTAAFNDEQLINDIETGYVIFHKNETISNNVYDTAHLAITITVTFDANQGTVTEQSRAVEVGTAIGVLPTPTRTDYVFEGWFTDPTNGTEVTKDTIFNSAQTIYAHWVHQSQYFVAQIGNNQYSTVSAAISAAPNNRETTITLVRNVSESLTIAKNKNIKLDCGNYTLSNDSNSPVITLNGTLTFIGGTITSDGTQGAINVNKNAKFYMTGGTVSATGTRQAIYVDGGRAEISGNSVLSNVSVERAAVHNLNKGTTIITSGTIISENYYGVENASGTVTIGVKDGTIDASSPTIRGYIYGINNSGTFNFYDGILKGQTLAINGTVTAIETNANMVNSTEVIGGATYYTANLN